MSVKWHFLPPGGDGLTNCLRVFGRVSSFGLDKYSRVSSWGRTWSGGLTISLGRIEIWVIGLPIVGINICINIWSRCGRRVSTRAIQVHIYLAMYHAYMKKNSKLARPAAPLADNFFTCSLITACAMSIKGSGTCYVRSLPRGAIAHTLEMPRWRSLANGLLWLRIMTFLQRR